MSKLCDSDVMQLWKLSRVDSIYNSMLIVSYLNVGYCAKTGLDNSVFAKLFCCVNLNESKFLDWRFYVYCWFRIEGCYNVVWVIHHFVCLPRFAVRGYNYCVS